MASLFFPHWDEPQLRNLLDFLSLIFISNTRVEHDKQGGYAVWTGHEGSGSEDGFNTSVLSLLLSHKLLRVYVCALDKKLVLL